MRSWLIAMICVACGNDGDASYGDPLDDPQLPARGYEDAIAWLEAGYYQSWTCEVEPHPARPGSGHRANRICNNDAMVRATDGGAFPVGAAAVKELYSGAAIVGYAVSRRVDDGAGGDSWYWFEGEPGDVPFNGEGEGTCVDCHNRAARDFVFTVLR
jgi:hypothetical protein